MTGRHGPQTVNTVQTEPTKVSLIEQEVSYSVKEIYTDIVTLSPEASTDESTAFIRFAGVGGCRAWMRGGGGCVINDRL